jgi:hypothetical protein
MGFMGSIGFIGSIALISGCGVGPETASIEIPPRRSALGETFVSARPLRSSAAEGGGRNSYPASARWAKSENFRPLINTLFTLLTH